MCVRQTDRQTDRQTNYRDREADGQTDTHSERERERERFSLKRMLFLLAKLVVVDFDRFELDTDPYHNKHHHTSSICASVLCQK